MTYTDKQIDRLVQAWLSLADGQEDKPLASLRADVRSYEACGDATAECGARAEEYRVARAYGLACIRNLIKALETPIPA